MKIPKTIHKKDIKTIPLQDCIAKTYIKDFKIYKGISVYKHCLIVGEVSKHLLVNYPNWLKQDLLPKGSELIVALHDIGKVSPTFQDKIYNNFGQKLSLLDSDINYDNEIGGHTTIGQNILMNQNISEFIPNIVGRHHGKNQKIQNVSPCAEIYGGQAWQNIRLELLNKLQKYFDAELPEKLDIIKAMVLTGLTTISDWIGSSIEEDIDEKEIKSMAQQLLKEAGFTNSKIRKFLLFEDIFGFVPNKIQTKFSELVTKQGIYVLEAPMGLGKTEAALYCAYKLLKEDLATGIYFALPTRLTSDKIHGRVNKFLNNILEEDNNKALLLYKNSLLKKTNLSGEASVGKSWFNTLKRGIVSPFSVGTVDQILMSILNVTHNSVRCFGLIGKVVIIDEIHTYDAYTGTILENLIKVLKKLHCTVIILSATLNKNQLKKMLQFSDKDMNNKNYPIIYAFPNGDKPKNINIGKMKNINVKMQQTISDERALEESLLRAEEGQQVLWIENTVPEAQQKFKLISSRILNGRLNVECGLVHSHFIKADRNVNEEKWINIFGKNNQIRKIVGRILIGTQVLEQSLDIDADFLITRISPIDMLLQRIGRLWRHQTTKRPVNAQRECWVLSPKLKDALEDISKFNKTEKVYAPYILFRTLEIINNIKNINLPKDIPILIDMVYSERNEIDKMNEYKTDMKNRIEKLRALALSGLSINGKTLSD